MRVSLALKRSVLRYENKTNIIYIIDKYNVETNDFEETISFPIHETNEQSLLPYMNENCDIWLGRHTKRRGGEIN